MRYKIVFSYDGTRFNGYQKQPSLLTIQGEMEKALKYINNDKNTVIHSSGRTDRGVHANNQVCHVDINVDITEYKLKRALNSLLPDDIYVKSTQVVSDDFHSRYMAKSKEYYYLINLNEFDPIKRNYVYQFCKGLDIGKMKEASKCFLGKHDFRVFSNTEEDEKDTIREIYDIKFEEKDGILKITFNGNGFLKYMVRTMVGTLIEVGKGKITKDDISNSLLNKQKLKQFKKAPSCGLYLNNVFY